MDLLNHLTVWNPFEIQLARQTIQLRHSASRIQDHPTEVLDVMP